MPFIKSLKEDMFFFEDGTSGLPIGFTVACIKPAIADHFKMFFRDVRRYLSGISPSAMFRVFKRLRLHDLIKQVKGSYKYFLTAFGKEVIAAGFSIRNPILIPALA